MNECFEYKWGHYQIQIRICNTNLYILEDFNINETL
jgi:hypothetical protein